MTSTQPTAGPLYLHLATGSRSLILLSSSNGSSMFWAPICACACFILCKSRLSPMGRTKRTRKAPLVPKEKLSSASHKVTQSTISTFHSLLKQRKRIERQLASSATHGQHEALERELQDIDRQVNELGGLEAYQQASTLGQSSQRGGDSSHVLIKWLKNLRASTDWEVPLR